MSGWIEGTIGTLQRTVIRFFDRLVVGFRFRRGSMTTQSTCRFPAVLALLVCFAGEMHSQTTFATITGSTVDGTGAAIPGVIVTATNTESNISTAVQSNASGVYTLAQLKEGTYSVR